MFNRSVVKVNANLTLSRLEEKAMNLGCAADKSHAHVFVLSAAAAFHRRHESHQGEANAYGCLTEHSRSEEHTSELQSLMRISYAVFCLKKKKNHEIKTSLQTHKSIQTQTI